MAPAAGSFLINTKFHGDRSEIKNTDDWALINPGIKEGFDNRICTNICVKKMFRCEMIVLLLSNYSIYKWNINIKFPSYFLDKNEYS